MSNFLKVPTTTREGCEGGAWVLRQSLEKGAAEKAEVRPTSSSKAGSDNGESETSHEDKPEEVDTRLFYRTLVNEARNASGDAGPLTTFLDIPWIDHSLVDEGITFHKKYYAHEIVAITIGVLLGFAIKPLSALYLKSNTGRSNDPEAFYNFYVTTVQRILNFFDFPSKPDLAFDEILQIRQLHTEMSASFTASETGNQVEIDPPKSEDAWKLKIAQAIRTDLEFLDAGEDDPESETIRNNLLTWDSTVALTQWDLVAAQWLCWIYLWLCPPRGVKDRVEQLRGVTHIWAILGKLVGIQDQYNVCLVKMATADAAKLHEKLFKSVLLTSLKNVDETVITLQSTFVEGLRRRVPFLTYNALLYFSLRNCVDGFEGENLWKLMTWKDKLSLRGVQAGFWLMRYSKYFRLTINYLLYFCCQLQLLLYLPGKKWRLVLPRYLQNSVTFKLF